MLLGYAMVSPSIAARTMSEQASSPNGARKVYLLLTATVDVRGVEALARNDPLERLNDYSWALERWTRCRGVDGLIFVENSGYDIDELRRVPRGSMHESTTEFLSFDGQGFPRELGKGFGETLNLEHALENSQFLAGEESLLLRVNGRNYVENIDAFIEALFPSTEILCDFKQSLTWGDGRVLGGTVGFYKRFVCPYGREVNDSAGYYFEHALARAMHRGMSEGLEWRPFPEPPLISGFSGTSNTFYADNRLRRTGRAIQHKLKLRMLRL